jgi:outer membrane protein OmpA-like peptidoglycan-associated protein
VVSKWLLLCCAAALASACVTGAALRARAQAVEEDVAQAKKSGGQQCAPRELATAEANLDFSLLEIDQGDSSRADEHLKIASVAARQAVALSKECGPVQVTIRDKPKEAPPPPPQIKVALKDTDGDGVPDIDDLCPDVPGPKENRGCPLNTDRDGDGVPDTIDRCPDVAGPKENQGCPWPDRDGDGVLDKDDKCPDDPGPKENQGCPRKQSLIVVRKDRIELKQQVHFATSKSRILPDSFELLRQVAQAMKDAPHVQMRIEGHTDNVGKLEENMALSQQRADTVRDYLLKQGVEPPQIIAEGYGPTRPIASNLTKAGKAANRRVEFRTVESAPKPGPAK